MRINDLNNSIKDNNLPVFQYMDIDACCGCEACANCCPMNIVDFEEDELGFVIPYINSSLCNGCGSCIRTCPQLKDIDRVVKNRKCLAGYSKDEEVVENSSSGGLVSCIINAFKSLYHDSYFAGVVWNDGFDGVQYILTDDIEDLDRIRSSKYIQARKHYIYREVEKTLQAGHHILFTGCPCEVAGLKSFLKTDYSNLFTIDMVCKGPTSSKVFNEYFDYISEAERPYHVNLRCVGGNEWIPQWMLLKYKSRKDIFLPYYKTPLGQAFKILQRNACYSCRFCGNNRYSDLTLGDFHGADPERDYYNPIGTSIVIVNTHKGKELIDLIKDSCVLEEVTYEEIVKHNPRIEKPWGMDQEREVFAKTFARQGLFAGYKATFSLRYRMRVRLSCIKDLLIIKLKGVKH